MHGRCDNCIHSEYCGCSELVVGIDSMGKAASFRHLRSRTNSRCATSGPLNFRNRRTAKIFKVNSVKDQNEYLVAGSIIPFNLKVLKSTLIGYGLRFLIPPTIITYFMPSGINAVFFSGSVKDVIVVNETDGEQMFLVIMVDTIHAQIVRIQTRQKIFGREIRNIASSQSHGHEIFHRNFSISELREAVGHISWKYGVPAIWKKAIVVPIPKKNKPLDDLNSYRPISLTSILSKVMERMITSRFDWYLETNNLLTSSQAGFRKCQSTNQQVVFLGQSIKDALDQRHSALALFVDVEAAFDKVWWFECIQKLQTLGVCNNMLMWIRNFISQRFSAVRFGNGISSFKQSETGLPQGTVISPILFNIFIDDLPDLSLLASDGLTNTALFADDLAIWCSTPKRDQYKLNTILNLTLERLHLWYIENNMTVNLKKTTCQFFTLNRQPFSPQLVYNGMPVQQSDVSFLGGCALDNKLKWTKHAEIVVSKPRKRLSILKRLAGVKWGCNRDTLNTTYKTYIQPVLNYCTEVRISASENVRKLLDTFHNQALRIITGGVKTTPVLVMQLLCDLQPFTNIIEKNAAILLNRLIRLPNNSFWRDYDSDGGRNLKTQKGFIQCVRENIQYKVINHVPFELLSFANPLDYAILDIRLDLVLNVRKRDLNPTALHAIALETINTRFPPEEWLHIYTDGSLLDFAQGAGIGVFSHLFSFYLHAGPLTTHFDGEVEAIHIALQQLPVRLPPIERAVILSDSTSALQALSNYNENNYLRV
ncbi:probable RNA-directed DNA polymerase from transposon X-element [Trichonephila clavipes]|nr:probable RNA-directed DNA polymerase from transposon X-element [Trichonephila clavipes]